MRNSITRLYRSFSSFVPGKSWRQFALVVSLAAALAVGINSWQELNGDYWRNFNEARVTRLRSSKGIAVGELAPQFSLQTQDGKRTVDLKSLAKKPVVLIFGSATWGPFRSQFGSIDRLYEQFRDRVSFCFVYIVESHPTFLIPHATTLSQRAERAEALCSTTNSSIPVLLDDLQNSVADAYHVFDEKAVLIDQGRIVYFTENEGNPEGPDHLLVEQLKDAIVDLLAHQSDRRT
jgi:alkyl hydroperoxide reductase subunit AhpC